MRIKVLEQQVDDVIAEDDLEGQFFLRSDGTVWYRHHADERIWFVNEGRLLFRDCLAAFSHYCDSVAKTEDERAAVHELELALTNNRALGTTAEPTYWSVILEQCKDGLL
jgi:hypothetical protein